jgi:hypothetical protein
MGWDRRKIIMKKINEYLLIEGVASAYLPIEIPEITELKLPKNAHILSVLSSRDKTLFSIKAYVEENGTKEMVTKMVALVTENVPNGDVGWRFLNSLVVSTGSIASPENNVYHAYVKIC